MPYNYAYGAPGGTRAITVDTPLGTQDVRQWGSVTPFIVPTGAIGAGLALTTSQGYIVNPFPRVYLYDVFFSITGSGTGGNALVDLYNAIAGGSSYLQAPFSIPAGLSAFTTYSARFSTTPNLAVYNDPLLAQGIAVDQWNALYSWPQGAIFDVRVQTPASTGSLTNMQVQVLLVNADGQGFLI